MATVSADWLPSLNQRAVGVEEKLCVVHSSTVTLVDADRHDNTRLSCSCT
jgi:hypothetical protein